ncbi:hypothetical protein LTR05_002535 [Lithohypha guttulata]|uniref:DUF7924 domain-containing protein n=1 Tax=Lithohypha guttulata TaxID=1690604 RepID=A0AAN7Y7S9_9EURO|nr:hypothetical protein LTR05_002535 [Lithohypha guttulata]
MICISSIKSYQHRASNSIIFSQQDDVFTAQQSFFYAIANHWRKRVARNFSKRLSTKTMDEERWSDLAFSLGIAARQGQRQSAATQKLAQKMSKRKQITAAQTYDCIKPFVESLISACPKLSQQNRCTYNGDAVPTDDAFKNTINRLPCPKPAISVGYSRHAFSIAQDELQNGIIAGPSGEPYDLSHLSQPIPGHFWPFFVVEISDHSMAAARQASAISAATCNNALSLVAGAAFDGNSNRPYSPSMFDHKFAMSFSLSIHGEVASLGVHKAEAHAPHVATQIATYNLSGAGEVAALADRIYGIFVWAHYNRLAEIMATIDQLERRVHGQPAGLNSSPSSYDFDPHCLKTLKLQPSTRPDRAKVVFKAGLPSWLSR